MQKLTILRDTVRQGCETRVQYCDDMQLDQKNKGQETNDVCPRDDMQLLARVIT